MHRFLLLALSVLPCACSSSAPAPCCCGFETTAGNRDTFLDTDDDGLPDTRVPAGAAFLDTDGDGLPDARLADATPAGTLDAAALHRAYRAVLTAGTAEDQRAALANLARAVADAQAASAR